VQIISGLIEQRFLDVVLKDRQLLSNACSFLVRSANTYLGSAMMIDYLKLVVRTDVITYLNHTERVIKT
jgi:hypothetical protein